MAQLTLTWVDLCASETGFEIERSLDGVTGWTLIFSPAANAESYIDTGLADSTTYYYRVRAKRGAERSAYTNIAFATTPGGEANLLLAYLFEDGAITDNSGSTGATHDLTAGGICEE